MMYERNFFDQVSGGNSTLPWSADEALKNGYTRWMDRDGCRDCEAAGRMCGPKARYLKDNSCSMCMMTNGAEAWTLWVQGSPDRPIPWSTSPDKSRELGIDWYYGSQSHPVVCINGPHLRKTSMATGRCVECEADAKIFRSLLKGPRAAARVAGEKYYLPTELCPSCGTKSRRHVVTNVCSGCSSRNSPRAIARAAGEKYYLPTDPCPSCGTLAKRHVVTNGCTGCHGKGDARRTPSQIFAEENPEFIMSRESARDLGFTLFRTGDSCRRGHKAWRYVSTGNCLVCLRG